MKVLIVEDSEIIRQHLMETLAAFTQVEVIGAVEHAAEAKECVRATKPDVLLLDIRLRSGSGIDVLEEIKNDPVRPVVIVITNFSIPQYRMKCLEAGADYFLDKSTEFERVPHIFEELIEQWGNHRAEEERR